jgi:Type ISP C-terminal specificity domain/N-6 DNA Methylase
MAASSLNLESALAAYGRAAKAKLSAIAVRGEPEDQLRSPIEQLIADLAQLCGLERRQLTLVGESSIADLKTRPDFAVSYADTLIGFIEVKAPGKGADPRRFKTSHDQDQWRKLTALPNLIYTDGNAFSLWRNGERVGEIQHLRGDIESAGATLAASTGLLALFDDFFRWLPVPPRTAAQLADTTARLCRLLRDEVTEQLARGDPTLIGLARDWRQLLFPEASDEQFADGYAQAVTFGLLLARAQDISLDDGADAAARALSTRHSLIGAALRVLTDAVVANHVLATSVATLSRVLAVVDWPQISKGDPDAWLYFYEDFLAVYDNDLRKQTGSYYTPVQVVKAMARLVDEALRGRFELTDGLASQSVTLADPAMGTGTFLLEVVRSIAATVAQDQGEGAVPAAVGAALGRLIGFELQLGPFAVAQLRMFAELASLGAHSGSPDDLRMFVTNTLDNPYQEEQRLGTWYEPIAASHREANRIKVDEPVLVVLGNPPYKERSRGKGGWIEAGNEAASQPAPMAAFLPPSDWGIGPHVRHLYNPYVYFWRWGTWKVFDHHPDAGHGVVCFITVSGFIGGLGFQRMRDYLRQRADAVYVIDCSPEGHQPPIGSRIFQGVQQPVCITIAIRDGSTGPQTPAPVWFRKLTAAGREEKFNELAAITLDGDGWVRCPDEWRAPFLPAGGSQWSSYPALDDLLRWSGTGIMSGRAWIVAPDKPTLQERWMTLLGARAEDKPDLFIEHKRDRRVDTVLSDGLPGFPASRTPIGEETGLCPEPVQIGYRSFDRQWIIPDKRVINQPNPTLWSARSQHQAYLTAPNQSVPSSGPAVTFTGEIPDAHHYHGRGGRVFPLWLDAAATVPNIAPGLLDRLSRSYLHPITAEDIFSYLAAVLAHPGYVKVFTRDLTTPGVRAPLTTSADLFARAVAIGRKVLWLHTYGQRLTDPSNERPRRAPRLPPLTAPKVLAEHPIPSDPDGMPDLLDYHPETQQLQVGSGRISNVTPRMWSYDISGVNVLGKWFSYRRKTRERPVMGDRRVSRLQAIQPDRWLAEYTSELIDLLNVIGPEAVKAGETPGGQLVCMSASGVGWLIQATVGSLGGVGGRANRCGLAA